MSNDTWQNMNRRNLSSAKRCLKHTLRYAKQIKPGCTDDDGLSVIVQCYVEFILILLYKGYVGCVEYSPLF
jgi:hypothetical protein